MTVWFHCPPSSLLTRSELFLDSFCAAVNQYSMGFSPPRSWVRCHGFQKQLIESNENTKLEERTGRWSQDFWSLFQETPCVLCVAQRMAYLTVRMCWHL